MMKYSLLNSGSGDASLPDGTKLAIFWTDADFLSVRSSEIHLRAFS